MPRKYTRRRGRKTPWYSKRYSVGQMAKKAWSTAKYVKSLINVEKKFCDITSGGTTSSTGAVFCANLLALGTTYNTRTGISVKSKSWLFRLTLARAVANTSPINIVRLILFIDNENQSALPAASDVLESVTMESPLNHLNGSRFRILSDRHITMSLNGTEGRSVEIYKSLSHHMKYNNGNTGTITDIREGSIFFLLVTDQASNQPAFQYYSRLRFVDN